MSEPAPASFHDDVLELTRDLVRRPSVTPDDAGCQDLVAARLATAGFRVERQRFGEVDNLWARLGQDEPLLVFLGHTDVVPPGPEDQWQHPPFAADVADGMLWGRGAADMKGSVAAMVVAAERFAALDDQHVGSIAILLTSDEEGPAVDGTRRMVEWLGERGEHVTYCVVGEPSCDTRFGDTLRVGRRGTLSGDLLVHGVQGHVAYPHRARNPLHDCLPALTELIEREWDRGDEDFPPTSFQISNLNAGTGAENVIPGTAQVRFNFRYGPIQSATALQAAVREVLDRHGVDCTLDWRHGGEPFRTPPGRLRSALAESIHSVTGIEPAQSTAGGTSDGRFVAPTGAQVIEFGPRNATIHQIDERVAVDDLAAAALIHFRLARRLLASA